MTRQNRSTQPSFGILALLVTAVIVYGSLFPFDFHQNSAPGGPVAALLRTWRQGSSRGDLISNVLLYLPLGFLASLAWARIGRVVSVLLATLWGVSLSVGMELAQFYDAGRSTAMSDVYCNGGGTLLGAVAAAIVGRDFRLPLVGGLERRPVALMLLVAFLGYRLYPFAPVIDLHKYLRAIEPVIHAPVLRAADVFRHTVIFLALALIIETVFGAAERRINVVLFVLGVFLLRVVVVDVVLNPAELVGAAIAVLSWIAVFGALPSRAGLIAVLFAGMLVVQGLEPFQFRSTPRAFGWIPFLSFMQGSIETNVRSLFEKVFLYGGMLWLLLQAGWRLVGAAPTTAALVLAVRYAQVYLPDRSAEITDFFIVILLALVMKIVPEGPVPEREATA